MNNEAFNIACRAELGRYSLIFDWDINKRILMYIYSYLQSKEQISFVIQSLVMSIDLHCNGKTSFYTNLIKMLNYNIPFSFNHDNLDYTKILHFVDHTQKKYITHWNISFAIHESLNFIMFLRQLYAIDLSWCYSKKS